MKVNMHEAKSQRSLTKDVGRGLCAFANAGGGTVLLGVSDAGKIVGVADHNRLKARVLSTARSADPPIGVEAESLGDVLRVVVPPQKRKPYSFGGWFFMRDGASSRPLSNAEVEELFYAAGRLHFDRKPCRDFSIDNNLDDETWARFSRRAKIPESMDRQPRRVAGGNERGEPSASRACPGIPCCSACCTGWTWSRTSAPVSGASATSAASTASRSRLSTRRSTG